MASSESMCEDPGESLSAHRDFVMGDIVLVI